MDTTSTTNFAVKGMSPQLLVSDIERSVEFYTHVLGFTVEFRYEDFYAGLTKDGFSIHLKLGRPGQIASKGPDDLDLVFSVDEIESVYERLLTGAVRVVQKLREAPYGKEFYVSDPDGHVLAFLG